MFYGKGEIFMKTSILFHDIYVKYHNQMWIHSGNTGCGFYSYILSREVVVPPEAFQNPDVWDVFALLHEIGHIKTNTVKQKRYYQEYLATQWAIEEAKKIGFKVPKTYLDIYQNYIWKWRETSIKLRGKNILDKEEVRLVI
jgi:hypothetical protein